MTAAEKLPCELILSSGHAVLLDPDDYVWASRWSWQAHSSSLKRLGQVYAFRATRKPDGRRSGEFLHRVIMGAGPGQVVDHVSGDTLDCRRANLRITDRRGNAQNIRNSKRLKRGEYKGVGEHLRWPNHVKRGIQAALDEAGSACRPAFVLQTVSVAYGHLAGTRAPRVLELVRAAGKVPHALALTKDGVPRHPRGIPASARPFPLEVAGG